VEPNPGVVALSWASKDVMGDCVMGDWMSGSEKLAAYRLHAAHCAEVAQRNFGRRGEGRASRNVYGLAAARRTSQEEQRVPTACRGNDRVAAIQSRRLRQQVLEQVNSRSSAITASVLAWPGARSGGDWRSASSSVRRRLRGAPPLPFLRRGGVHFPSYDG
jgi:hypothetical protein